MSLFGCRSSNRNESSARTAQPREAALTGPSRWLLITPLIWACSVPVISKGQDADAPDVAAILARGDVTRSKPPEAEEVWLPLYLGNGRLGSCFGPWGLHVQSGRPTAYRIRGATHFTHLKHWVRAKYNADYVLPTAAMYWEAEPQAVREYRQRQSFHDSTVRTRFRTDAYSVDLLSWVDPVHRDVVGLRIDVEGECPAIVFAPFRQLSVHYKQQMEQSFEGRVENDTWKATLTCLSVRTPLSVKSTSQLTATPEGVRLNLRKGRNEILVTIGNDAAPSAEQSLRETQAWWHSLWADSAWLDLPDDDAQKVWIRSLAYVLYSHNDDGIGCPPPCGLTGNGWPFPFPFDSGCCHPLLLWTGRIDSARKWIEFWHSRSEGLKQYTRRIWKKDGMMLPHVFPYGSSEDFHLPEPPNENYYPVYNAGHMARMAHQTALMVNDEAWTRKHAVPLIEGAARFYLDVARRGEDGLWHFFVTPSLGLDESGGLNQPDYICTLVSAEYAFRLAIQYGLDKDGRMQAILRDGLAYKTLLSEKGLYHSHGGPTRDLGRQKHPDQLSALIHIPLGSQADSPTRQAHTLRYDITDGAKSNRFIGHTLGEVILSSARMHDADGWRKDWNCVQPSSYADADWIQFYESSGNGLAYYVTTHGLFAQALLETVVSTWWERLDLAPCVPWPGTVRFGNIRTTLGVTVSGQITDGRGQAMLKAWKDTKLRCQGEAISLRKGEERILAIGVP